MARRAREPAFPHPQLEAGGLGPGHPEDAMPTSGQEGGREGVEVLGPGPSGLESPERAGPGRSERAGALRRARLSGVGLKGGRHAPGTGASAKCT